MKYRILFVLGLALAGVALFSISRAETSFEPTMSLPTCQLPFSLEGRAYVSTAEYSNGLVSHHYTLPNRRRITFVTIGRDENTYPLYYILGGERPELTYVDQRRDGSCAGVKLYYIHPSPTEKGA